MTRAVAVVHLAHRTDGIAPLQEFVRSYIGNPAGIEHELIVAFKGFGGGAARRQYQAALAGVNHRAVDVPDAGMDIGAYRAVARSADTEVVCLLNSFSVLLSPGWLAKLEAALGSSVGAAAASGSWESILEGWQHAHPRTDLGPGARVQRRVRLELVRSRFAPFPNPHLRTNGLLIRNEHFLQLRFPRLLNKNGAHRFESGIHSLTRQLSARGLGAVVVGRDGVAYGPAEWPRSGTFRVPGQPNLLVADNRTRQYEVATPDERIRLAQLSWGSATVWTETI